MSKKYFIKTFGCQMNHSDSERIAGFLENNYYKPALKIDGADLVVFNTCGVRQMAEDRVYGQIHNIRKREAANNKQKSKIIVLTGCLANRKDVQKRLKDKVDLFCEIKNFPEKFKEKIVGTNLAFVRKKGQIQDLSLQYGYLSIIPKYINNFSAYVPIMTGCNNFCSYCVVPYARGRETSRPASEVLKEIKALIKNGYKEITLLGQNVNSYKDGKINFSKLLKKVDAIPGKFWINFVSNHPKDVTPEMIEMVGKCRKVCENFHLPIQSGSDEIIRNMNRKYTAKQYLEIIKKIKSAFEKHRPGVIYSLTSDIIVGFPGETKKEFLKSAKIMKKVGYDMVFFGQYSPRPGTAAWKMKDNVSKTEKERREKFLNEILKKTAFANNQKYLDTVQEVLIEKWSHPKGNLKEVSFRFPLGKIEYFGKTRTGKNVKIITDKKYLVGKFAKVKITKANIWNLEAVIK